MPRSLSEESVYKTDAGTETGSNRAKGVPDTGIKVIGQLSDGSASKSYDIKYLDRDSLSRWLRSRGGKNELAEDVVRHMLGHGQTERSDE